MATVGWRRVLAHGQAQRAGLALGMYRTISTQTAPKVWRWTQTLASSNATPTATAAGALVAGLGLAGAAYLGLTLFSTPVVCDPSDARKLCSAIRQHDTKTVKNMVVGGHPVDERHPLGWNPLLVAVGNNDIDMTKLLLELGADINVADDYSPERGSSVAHRANEFTMLNPRISTKGMTPLHYAAALDNPALVNLLLEKGADPTLKDHTSSLPQDYASSKQLQEILAERATALMTERKQALDEERRRKRKEFPLEKRLHKHIVGQNEPIAAVSAAIRRRENGWHDEDHPLVFLFLGSSGVGKTELAKRIAQHVHGDDDTRSRQTPKGFIRLDMSEFHDKHHVAKLIGSPPGYIGYDEGGQLTKKLKECPDAVVLFDEIEKCHTDVLTVMLQLFDEGRLTDGQGNTVDCKDAIFVMTSNLAADVIADHAQDLRIRAEQVTQSDENINLSKNFKSSVIKPILKSHFERNEFLGRIDEILYFLPFSKAELGDLVVMELDKWRERAEARHSILLSWDDSILQCISDEYDIHYGARSLQHAVDKLVVNKLAADFEQEKLRKGDAVHLTFTPEKGVMATYVPADKRSSSSDDDSSVWSWFSSKSSKSSSSASE
eukprot:m.189715 g.189715  ORF g.189715 m.189715 type:complete len:607 (-) comp14799_c0_seq1:155-1975(-)